MAAAHQDSSSAACTRSPGAEGLVWGRGETFWKGGVQGLAPTDATGGRHRCVWCFGSDPSRKELPAQLPILPAVLDGFRSPLVLSAPGMMPFWGHRGLDVVSPGGDPLAARRRLSPPAFSESLARRPAAFHCCLFIRLNSLPSLSCSSRGTEAELVPAAGPHPLLPRSEGRGRRDTEARGLCPTPPGPRGRAASQQIQY